MKITDAVKRGFKMFPDGEWRQPTKRPYKTTVYTIWQRWIKKQCRKCTSEFLASHDTQDFCSNSCARTGVPSAMKGKTFSRKGSYGRKRLASNGYTEIYMPGHPLCDTKGRVLEHRLIIFNKIKRPLTFNDVVHHINGIRSDNRPENLVLLTRGIHNSHHKPEEAANRVRDGKGRFI